MAALSGGQYPGMLSERGSRHSLVSLSEDWMMLSPVWISA